MSQFETKDGHLNLDKALDEILFLYYEYGLEDDGNLTLDAKELKQKILAFVNRIKSL